MISLPITRRLAIQRFMLVTASALAGNAWVSRLVAASIPLVRSTGTLILNLNDFPSLTEEGGSVQLDVGLDKPIIINRAASAFHVLSAFCQHNGCTVNAFDPDLGVMRCPCHGSRYNIDGSLNQGPALRGLDKFDATFNGNDRLTITLPGITFAARDIAVTRRVGATTRLKLSFNATIFTSYQVQYRPSLTPGTQAQTIPFSLTPNGSATETTYRNTVFNSSDPLPRVDLYVDVTGPVGFFSIVLAL